MNITAVLMSNSAIQFKFCTADDEIDGFALMHLDEADIKQLVPKMGPRKKLKTLLQNMVRSVNATELVLVSKYKMTVCGIICHKMRNTCEITITVILHDTYHLISKGYTT